MKKNVLPQSGQLILGPSLAILETILSIIKLPSRGSVMSQLKTMTRVEAEGMFGSTVAETDTTNRKHTEFISFFSIFFIVSG